jgi:hemin uptake protein HemP
MMMTRDIQTANSDLPEASLPVHDATELTAGGHLARIRLDDKLYTLRITRVGKLILTK